MSPAKISNWFAVQANFCLLEVDRVELNSVNFPEQ
jgi:hypothetical protein